MDSIEIYSFESFYRSIDFEFSIDSPFKHLLAILNQKTLLLIKESNELKLSKTQLYKIKNREIQDTTKDVKHSEIPIHVINHIQV